MRSDVVNKQSKHLFESVWLVLIVMVASFAALVLMGVSTSAATAKASTFSDQPAARIVAAARSAMSSSGSVEAVGSGHLTTSAGGQTMAAETNYTGPTSGSQVINVTPAGKGSSQQLPQASISLVGGALYVSANAAFWTASAGLPAADGAAVAGRWVEVPASSPIYAPTAADMSMPSLVKDMFHAKKFHKGTVRKVNGVTVIPIRYTNGGYDSSPTTLYVATGGKHLPVSATISGVTLRFSGWGKPLSVTAPAGAVPLASLLPAASSGPPVLA
jgi:hypothetical protein